MDYIDAVRFFYDKTSTCPDKKTIPLRKTTDNTLELRCKNWKLVIEKEKRENVFNVLEKLLNERDYDTYDKYIQLIIDNKKKIDKLEEDSNRKIEELNKLYIKRNNDYEKINISKLNSDNKKKLADHYKKYGLNNLSKFNQNEVNYLTWFDTCVEYIKLQKQEDNFEERDNIKKELTEYIVKKGSVKETSSSSVGKKIKKIKINKK